MKFNATEKGKTKTTNYMGGVAFKQTEKEELAFAVVTTFLEDSYYESRKDRVTRIRELVKEIVKKDPKFISNLAIITRTEFHMRSAFHVLVGELAKNHKGDSLVAETIEYGYTRPDDLIEIIAYLGRPIPNSVKKAVREIMSTLDAYQLGKYQAKSKTFSMIDLFNLLHPKPTKKNEEIFKQFMEGKLSPPETWEVLLSTCSDKAKVWKQLVSENKLGYMATLRNLRNMLEQADEATILKACKYISNKEAVLKSKQLPFRFLSAYEAVKGKRTLSLGGKTFSWEDSPAKKDLTEEVIKALNQALAYSVDNIPLLKGKTLILTDNSGSMRGDFGGDSLTSAYSRRTSADIANLFSVLYWTRCENTCVAAFGDTLKFVKLNREKSILDNFKTFNKTAATVGGGTETGVFFAFEKLLEDKEKVDRIIIFSDTQVGTGCQWYDTGRRKEADFNKLFQQYKKFNPKVQVYSVDLRGYGNSMISDGAVKVAGWSDKIFDLMQFIEKKEGFVQYIEKYKPTKKVKALNE
jgi:60 kDa SS-A/Ro ribonucleoprotein